MSSPTIRIYAKDGSVKRISAEDIKGDMGSDAVWYSAEATIVSSIPHTLDNEKKEWVVWERGYSVTIDFSPDGDGDDGQGFYTPTNAFETTVDAVAGDTFIVRGKFLTPADTKVSAYSNGNRVAAAVNDILRAGDVIVCAKGDASFRVKFAAPETLPGAYVMSGFVQLDLMD